MYFLSNCDFIGYAEWEALEAGVYSDSALWHYQGVASAGEWVLSMPNVVLEPTSGSAFSVNEWSNLSLSNLPPGLESGGLPVSLLGGEQACVSYAGIPSTEGVYPILVSGDLTVSLFGNPYSVGTFNVVGSIEIVTNTNPIPG